MSKISMFGVSASGKTCFLYAMAQVLGRGVSYDDDLVQIIATRARLQTKLNDGFMQLAEGRWPDPTNEFDENVSESYFFKVSMRCNGHFEDVIDSLEFQDYRGGLLQSTQSLDEDKFNALMDSFRGSSAIIFIVDGKTLIEALDENDKDVSHRGQTDVLNQFRAQSQIRFVENIFMEYKLVSEDIPPVLIAISKGDIFASDFERDNAKRLVKEYLPSIFSIGSKLTAGITIMSLGENLGGKPGGELTGLLSLSKDYNIHIPTIFGIYFDLYDQYLDTSDEGDKKRLEILLSLLAKILGAGAEIFVSGKQARQI